MKVPTPGLGQSWDLHLPVHPPWTDRRPSHPAAKSNRNPVLDVNPSSTKSWLCGQLCHFAQKITAQHSREDPKDKCAAPCLSFPACKTRDSGALYSDGCRENQQNTGRFLERRGGEGRLPGALAPHDVGRRESRWDTGCGWESPQDTELQGKGG